MHFCLHMYAAAKTYFHYIKPKSQHKITHQ